MRDPLAAIRIVSKGDSVTLDVSPSNVPATLISSRNVWVRPDPALNKAPEEIFNWLLIVQFPAGRTPEILVFDMVTSSKALGVPKIEIGSEPPKFTLPVLTNAAPEPRLMVVGDGANGGKGVRFRIPELNIVPLLIKAPRNVWVKLPPSNVHPEFTVNVLITVQFTLGMIPPAPVFEITTFMKVAFPVELKIGGIVPPNTMVLENEGELKEPVNKMVWS